MRTGGRAAACDGSVNPVQVGFAAGGTGTAGGQKRGEGVLSVIGPKHGAASEAKFGAGNVVNSGQERDKS